MVTADPGNARVTLNWSPVTGATSYNIYYATHPGVTPKNTQYTAANQNPPFVLRFLPGDITPLANGTTYYLVVTAVTAQGESVASKEMPATPSATSPPPAPVQVRAAAQSGQVALSWEAASGATSYQVYYRTTPGVTKANGTAVPTTADTSQIVAPLVTGMTYHFIVTASNANGESGASFELSCVPQANSPPSAPSAVTAVEGNRQISVSWAPVGGATSYAIYYATSRNLSKANGVKIANVTSPYLMSALSNNQGYYIVVTAANAAGESVESITNSATPVAAQPIPQLVLIPGGSFSMGDTLDNTGYCLPVHTVNLEPFYIDRYETKYELWKEVYDWAIAHGYTFDNPGKNGSYNMGTNMPVTWVSWYDTVKWLNARSEKEGRIPVYFTDNAQDVVYRTGQFDVTNSQVKWAANGYRLPTEAEWEKAARGGLAGNRYPWGNDLGTGKANDNMGSAASVGSYPGTGYGLYDMAGNVFEWVWDLSSADYRWAGISIDNPHGPDSYLSSTVTGPTTTRVRRGGGFSYGSRYLKVYERMFRVPTYTAIYFGFRTVTNTP